MKRQAQIGTFPFHLVIACRKNKSHGNLAQLIMSSLQLNTHQSTTLLLVPSSSGKSYLYNLYSHVTSWKKNAYKYEKAKNTHLKLNLSSHFPPYLFKENIKYEQQFTLSLLSGGDNWRLVLVYFIEYSILCDRLTP